ncbi:hypothetical protein PRUPE_7G012400 [Prunus persica]|uniref:Cationic amino acid transporter C-terminal domain-containing protein n=1 Tax=Prunus persica TaxID=3760 RepID=A0A251N4S5_PRUPE|nr:hypothetical protein PRUPE_7G012400 [Prunus persica]
MQSSGNVGGGRKCFWGFRSLIQRKQVDSVHVRSEGHHQLARKLSVTDLIAIGVGATIGAGVYVLVGTVAREHAGPALTISFLIAGIAAALSAFCYAELACRCPSAGSAYHYSYICVGEGYFPFGINGMFAGSAVVFFSYIGFDSVTSTVEEVKNPQRDLPLGIGIALFICCILYMFVSFVITGLVPYYALDPDTPISSVFASYGLHWAVFIITTGAITALFASLLGSLLAQPRILMAMARDGLLPSFFSDINKNTQVPVKSTVTTGIFAAVLAFFMDVSQLAGMVSVGTLFAFTTAAVSVLILRYVPPDEVPLSSSLQESIKSVSLRFGPNIQESDSKNLQNPSGSSENNSRYLHEIGEASIGYPLIQKSISQENQNEQTRRKISAWTITFLCMGVFIFAFAASAQGLSSILRFTVCGVCGALLLCCLIVLTCTDQDDGRHSFGHTGELPHGSASLYGLP